MRYCGTTAIEIIEMNPMDDLETAHWIALEKSSTDNTFMVHTCCNDEWSYKFAPEDNSDYDRIQYIIMEMMYESETMDELLGALSEMFEDGFGELLIKDEIEE